MNAARGVLLSVVVPGAALACSGPGAGDAMATSSLIGLACLAVSFGATIFSVIRVRKFQLAKAPGIIAVVLLAVHPTVWLGVSSGDCGYTLRYAGPIFAALHLGVFGFLLTRKHPLPSGEGRGES